MKTVTTARRIDELEYLRARIALRPVGAGVAARYWQIIIHSQCDNVIYTSGAVTLKGIDYTGVVVTSVPALAPSTITSGFTSGLGKGTIVGTSTQVWVAPLINDGSTAISDLLQDLPVNMAITARLIGYLPVGATTVLAPVYIPWTF